MKKFLLILPYFFSILIYSQCNTFSDCNPNSGLYSGNDPSLIEYDNFTVAFHTSVVKDAFGQWKIWGANGKSDGTTPASVPQIINQENYPKLRGDILKVALGSFYGNGQLIVLTTEGLFAGGASGAVIPLSIKPTDEFDKVTVDSKSDGLPAGITPQDVKMLFASTYTLILTTCTGEVYVLSENPVAWANGKQGSDNVWHQVMENPTTSLKDVIVCRGQSAKGYALKKDGSLWTWGEKVQLGANQISQTVSLDYATKMLVPTGISKIKMIQMGTGQLDTASYFVLDDLGQLFVLGHNEYGQLGTVPYIKKIQKTWAISRYTDGSPVNDIVWVSSGEHQSWGENTGIITKDGKYYTAGNNGYYMIGREKQGTYNYWGASNGILSSDIITFCEIGSHCSAVIKKGSSHYGYAGHHIAGSMGDGTVSDGVEMAYNFVITPEVSVCGVTCNDPSIVNNSPVCDEEAEAIFTIRSTPNDKVEYSLNNGSTQTITIDSTGRFEIKIPNITTEQELKVTRFTNNICDKTVSIVSKIKLKPRTDPEFSSLNKICFKQTNPPLPTTSDNGIKGTWSPEIDNQKEIKYTFTPDKGQCAKIFSITIPLINNSNINIEELANNSINVNVTAGTPTYEYQLLDSEENIIIPWQPNSSFINLKPDFYIVQVRTFGTDCLSQAEYLFLNIPNVITPNNDGKNDKLNLKYLEKAPEAKLTIIDRFGKIMAVFNSTSTHQEYINFKSGTYWYIFEDGKGKTKNGWILVKNN
ncbi:gliding motility-associated C-terminal domain-containing protein [Soonwooa buanensis]|uniref:Gliding motility-associated C-terminal domain-containing protein n=1 Tax=Soonwooa buanensis TaxID=619805 RepID=A0A1T5CGF6_9FLAO|nr:T9SS type B sorting domain-containing protein [Soonwooa buanensis]SKB58582.1 gliding motility-associated C-terminal domain-containing protein [Soonwooa buanensis]